MKSLFYGVSILFLLTGCCDLSFEPYNYEKLEDAKIKIKGYSIRMHDGHIQIEKKMKLQDKVKKGTK